MISHNEVMGIYIALKATSGGGGGTSSSHLYDGGAGIPFSSIRTMTVGSGMTPDLLTPPKVMAGARGLRRHWRNHRRWGLPPRPENHKTTWPRLGRPGRMRNIVGN